MTDLGDWVARGVTYVKLLGGELFDGDEDETIGVAGQTMIVCKDVMALPTKMKKVLVPRDGVIGHYECPACNETVYPQDRFCRRCGTRFEEERTER